MVSNYEVSQALERLIKNIHALQVKIDLLPKLLSKQTVEDLKTLSFRATSSSGSTVLLSIAEHKTLEVFKDLKNPMTAGEVATITGRARAVESMYLNVLHRRGMLLKERQGRRAFFTLKEDYKNGSA
jgi:predicted transcriptional regulator